MTTTTLFRMTPLAAAIVSAGLLGATGAARADQLSDLEAAVKALQAQVEELKAQRAADAQKAAAAPALPAVVVNPPPVIPAATEIGTASQLVPVPRLLQIKTQGGSFMVYGDFDEYGNHMRSSSGAKINALQDGAILRSRLGFTGAKDFGSGYGAAFTLETGFNATNGAQADQPNANTTGLTTSGRLFDRQAWAGLTSTQYGELRVGRQNTDIQATGNYIDYTERNLGSVINSFGVPSRYDGDIAYLSPRIAGVQVVAHYAIGGGGQQNTSTFNQGVAQLRVDYVTGPIRVAYSGLVAKAPNGAAHGQEIFYHSAYANYDYGLGTIYAAYVHSNNGGGALNNTGGNEIGNIPSVVNGANTTSGIAYDIYQVSADYRLTSTLRLGGLYGKIKDTVNSSGSASGWSVGAFWQAFSNVTLYSLLDQMDNNSTGAFGLAGSAGLTKNFSGANLVGQRITGVQVGGILRF
jgi:predicted porin/outer membrane murein-binding lipoprotein Lpp